MRFRRVPPASRPNSCPFVVWYGFIPSGMIRTIAMASSKQAAAPSRILRLPSAIYFEADALARTAVTQCARIQHKSFESVEPAHLAGNNVFVLADPTMFTEHLKKLRAPNVRVIVVADQRLRDEIGRA